MGMQFDHRVMGHPADGAIEPAQLDRRQSGLVQQILKLFGDSRFSIVHDLDLQVRVFPYLLNGSRRILPETLQILLLTISRPSGTRKS
jgi:hypothetical protein